MGLLLVLILATSHVSLSLGLVIFSWKPLLDKRSGSSVTAWVELLLLKALVGETLYKPYIVLG